MIECITPTLKVREIESSIAFYEKTLGFTKQWSYKSGDYSIAGIARDGFSIYLCESGEGSSQAWIWIGIEDHSLFDGILTSGAKIVQPPKNLSYGYEMRIEDPDGHVLRLATGTRTDLPIES